MGKMILKGQPRSRSREFIRGPSKMNRKQEQTTELNSQNEWDRIWGGGL
jgi:hypothetical protein